MDDKTSRIVLIIQTREILCAKLGICNKTLRKELRKRGIIHRGHLTPLDLELFANSYGTPEGLKRMSERLK